MDRLIDLRSDTVTKPSPRMRRAMAEAEVGDDVYGEDPTINHLETLAAEMLGKEAAVYVVSGTMGNQAALLAHTRPGDEIILEQSAHIFMYELGGAGWLAGCQTRIFPGYQGFPTTEQVRQLIRGDNIHYPITRLLCLENTHNRGGGTVLSTQATAELCQVAHEHGVQVHLDGARVFNAAVALGVDVSELTGPVDSVQVCLSKGLGAPVGSILAGTHDFIARARRARKVMGGGMRQAGIIAAAGIVALTENVDRLAEDHAHARLLVEALAEMAPFEVPLETVQTNIVAFHVDPAFATAEEVVERLAARGVKAGVIAEGSVRMVTHLDVNREDIVRAIDVIADTVQTW